jgi:hypothetical protein
MSGPRHGISTKIAWSVQMTMQGGRNCQSNVQLRCQPKVVISNVAEKDNSTTHRHFA